jgi:hypothetical protein
LWEIMGRVSAGFRVVYNGGCVFVLLSPAFLREQFRACRVFSWMMHKPSNAPAPDDLLLTAREALKEVLADPDGDHSYTILMAMNAMGIAARAMGADEPPAVDGGMSDEEFRRWVRTADAAAVGDQALVERLRRHVEGKLSVSNPRFKPEQA